MAAVPSSHSSETASDGPVLTLLNKRIRALRKKLNRISQMEESLSRGKSLNKEQEEALRSKSFIVPLIDELERFRRPLLQAVDQEIQIALEKSDRAQSEEKKAQEESDESGVVSSAVADLLKLVYFGSMFDVRTLSMAHDNFMRRTHERNCCLSYDYVTDDDAAGDPLNEFDLDLVALLGDLLTSRPSHSHLSHKDTLKACVDRANLWLSNSNQPIQPNSSVTCMKILALPL